jgi:hypothetical protein
MKSIFLQVIAVVVFDHLQIIMEDQAFFCYYPFIYNNIEQQPNSSL